MPLINLNYIKSKSDKNICDKSNWNISDGVENKKLELDNLKNLINNCNISDKMTWIEKMPSNNFDYTKSKSYGKFYNKGNRNISNEVDNKELEFNNLEDSR